MTRQARGALLGLLAVIAPSVARANDLALEDRIRAQEAIERVAYSHQLGASKPFGTAVPRAVIERKVRLYLKQSLALERYWHEPITAEALSSELSRMLRDSRLPERLRELFAALGDDPILIQECLARPALAGRLVHRFYDSDPSRQRSFDAWWDELAGDLEEASVAPVARFVPLPVAPTPEESTGSTGVPCSDDQWNNGSLDDLPDPRIGHRSIWTGSEMIVWGGVGGGATYLDTGGRYDPATDSWVSISGSGAPSPRAHHSAVWTGSEMIVWGGEGTSPSETVTDDFADGARYDPSTDTWSSTSPTNAPTPRHHHTAVWTGSEMIVWGGEGFAGAITNTGKRYDPVDDTWTNLSLAGSPPAGRSGHTAVWTGSEMIIWGGLSGSFYAIAGSKYDPSADSWTLVSTADPPGRVGHTAVWTGTRMVVWGGNDGTSQFNSGGAYDPVADVWTETPSSNAPLARTNHTAIWTGSQMVVWGGKGTGFVHYQDGARWAPGWTTWLPIAATAAPSARHSHTAVWTGTRMIVWGGQASGGYPITGGRYRPSFNSWTPTATSDAPAPRTGHTALWTGSQMIVWGGLGSGITGSGGRYDPATDLWSPTTMTGVPNTSLYHSAVWTGNEMIVWGNGHGGRYDPIADAWSPTATLDAPAARYKHTAVWTGSEMIVWGGEDAIGALDTGARYAPLSDAWSAVSTAGAPAPRGDHVAVWTGSEMIVWGGSNGEVPEAQLDTGARYDPTGDAWSPMSQTLAPTARDDHSAVWTGTAMIVWGGHSSVYPFYFDSGGRYDPAQDLWTATSLANAPFPRSNHTAVWTGSEIIVWGGKRTSPALKSGARYDPVVDSWLPTSTTGSPAGRYDHTAVWTGSDMIVWGGFFVYSNAFLGTGGRYAWGYTSDGDADGFSECDGDCDDGSLAVFPGAVERCDGADNDCNGGTDDVDADGDGYSACSNDCNDADDGAHAVPAEVAGVAWSYDKRTMYWTPAAPGAGPGTVHDVVTGVVHELPVGGGATETCLASDVADEWIEDATEPAPGDGFWYLVRGRNSCGPGSYGQGSDGTEREAVACP